MKKTLKFINLGFAALVGVTAFAMPAVAQTTDEECNKIYNEKFGVNRKDKPDVAYEAAKEHQAKCKGKDADIDKYLEGWIPKYLKAKLEFDFGNAYTSKNYPDVYKFGKEILNNEPERVDVLIKLGYSGYLADKAGNSTFQTDAIVYGKKALQMLEAGKAPTKWDLFKDKGEAEGWLTYGLGAILQKTSPKEAATYYYKSTKTDSIFKTSSAAYLLIAKYYQAEFSKFNEEVDKKWKDVPITDDKKADLKADEDKLGAFLDRWADALARAISVETNAESKKLWTGILTDIFTERYKKKKEDLGADVSKYIAVVQKNPLPDPNSELKPAPIMEVPVDTTTSTTAAKPIASIASTTAPEVGTANPNGTAAKTTGATAKATTVKAPAKGKGSKAKKPR